MNKHSAHTPFDRQLVRSYRNRQAGHLSDHNFLINWTAKALIERLEVIKREFPLILQIGARHESSLDEILKTQAGASHLISSDLAETLLASRTESDGLLCCDPERLPFKPGCFDLIFSSFCLHTINDLPGTLIQIRRSLKPDGLFLAALPGGESLHELRQSLMQAEIKVKGGASPRVFPFVTKQQLGALLQRAGFALPVIDSEMVTVSYKDLNSLTKDLRGMGESNSLTSRSRTLTSRHFWEETEKAYRRDYEDEDSRLQASFEIIFLIGWAPAQNQPKPLKPGSANKSLAEALGSKEIRPMDQPDDS